MANDNSATSDALANVQATLQLSQVAVNGVLQYPSVQGISPPGAYNPASKDQFTYEGKRIPVTISLGIAILPDPAITDASELIRAADEALYASKKAGRNRATLHKPKA